MPAAGPYLDGEGIGNFWNRFTGYVGEKLSAIAENLPTPVMKVVYSADKTSAVIKLANNFIGYGDAVVRYKDGSDPTESDPEVTANGMNAIPGVIYFFRSFPAGESNYLASGSVIVDMNNKIKVAQPIVSVNQSNFSVSITCGTAGAEIRYTTNGAEPTESSTLYSGAFTIDPPTTIKAKAFKSGMISSDVFEVFVEEPLQVLPTPSISVARVNYNTARITISNYSSYPSGTKIVINGTSYSVASQISFSVGSSATSISVYATYSGSEPFESQSGSASTSIPAACATPSISESNNTVTITCSTSGATIYYRTGSSGSYSQYTGSFSISSSVYIYAYATTSANGQSATANVYCTYTPRCATPSISQSGNTVTITCSTSGATIHYRRGSSGGYSTGTSPVSFTISSTTTVYAYATRSGYLQSSTTSRNCTYTQPQCASPSISFSSSTNRVTITCSTSGATIYYRRGTSGSYSVYSGSFTISSTTTIYAYATKSGYRQSNTVSKRCTYTAPKCATPTISQSGNVVTFRCTTSGATIHYSGCGVSGTCSSGGTATITASGTMTAYATASGYSQSSTASKSCSYTMPDLPSISTSFRPQTNTMSYWVDLSIKADDTLPTGTQIDVEIYNVTNSMTILTKSNIGLGNEHLNLTNVRKGNKLRLTLTAHCEGYNPSIFTTTATVIDTSD